MYSKLTFVENLVIIFAGPRCVQRAPDYKLNWSIYLAGYLSGYVSGYVCGTVAVGRCEVFIFPQKMTGLQGFGLWTIC